MKLASTFLWLSETRLAKLRGQLTQRRVEPMFLHQLSKSFVLADIFEPDSKFILDDRGYVVSRANAMVSRCLPFLDPSLQFVPNLGFDAQAQCLVGSETTSFFEPIGLILVEVWGTQELRVVKQLQA